MSLPNVYPLKGLPRQGQIWSWISFDVANQSFTLIINTLLFSIFFQKVVVQDPTRDDQLWSIVFAASMLLVVIASPIAGAIGDARSWKKPLLLLTGFCCAGLTCLLGLIQPHQFWLAVLLYVPANFMFNLGENFLASFLPQLANRDQMGKVSGFSWACAYFAALLLLLAVASLMLTMHLKDPSQWRPFFVFAGLWFLAFTIPTLIFLKEERPAPHANAPATSTRSAIADGFRRLFQTAREVGKFRDLAMLLFASFFYGGGMAVIVTFASILAKDFGFDDVKLVIFTAVITLSGILGTLIPTFLQDKLGHKRTTLTILCVWIATTLYLAWIAQQRATALPGATLAAWPIWLAGNFIGFGLGSLGTANRAFVGFLTPSHRSGEFFGIWGLVFKLAALLVIPFGVAKDQWGTPQAILVLASFFVVGMVVTLLVNEERGAVVASTSA
jgi:MFS transporter, UMF1 family